MIVTRTAYVMDTTVLMSGNDGHLVDILFDQADGASHALTHHSMMRRVPL